MATPLPPTRFRLLLTGSGLTVVLVCWLIFQSLSSEAQRRDEEAETVTLWLEGNPGENGLIHSVTPVGTERDFTKPEDKLIAGRSIIKLGNVSRPEIHLYSPDDKAAKTQTAVIVCPGGGFNILAWDLEGTEVAKWLNSIGVTAAVLKYRVPTNRASVPWQAAVQDTQRAISIVRASSKELGLNPDQIGAMGFSAGAIAVGRSGLMRERTYPVVDKSDEYSCTPNFMALIYAGGLVDSAKTSIENDLIIDSKTPPTFMVHAFDDHVPLATPLVLMNAFKQANVPAELHVYDAGGHGYGLRRVNELPVTSWPDRLKEWMNRRGLLAVTEASEPAQPSGLTTGN